MKEGVKGSAVALGEPGRVGIPWDGEGGGRVDFESEGGGEREVSNLLLRFGGKSTGIEPT